MIGSTNSVWKIINNTYEQLINYTMLYDYGDECSNITGGWNGYACCPSNFSGYSSFSPTVTKNNDNIYVTKTAIDALGSLLTVNKIDITDYSKCNMYGYFSSYGNQYAWQTLYILKGNSGAVDVLASGSQFKNKEETTIANINLSSKTGEGYIGISYYYYGVTTKTNLYWCALFKKDDWSTLANLSEILASSIDDILTNSEILLSNEKAVEFMIKQCTGDFMSSAIRSETFLIALNNSKYKTTIMANEHWSKFLSAVA